MYKKIVNERWYIVYTVTKGKFIKVLFSQRELDLIQWPEEEEAVVKLIFNTSQEIKGYIKKLL